MAPPHPPSAGGRAQSLGGLYTGAIGFAPRAEAAQPPSDTPAPRVWQVRLADRFSDMRTAVSKALRNQQRARE